LFRILSIPTSVLKSQALNSRGGQVRVIFWKPFTPPAKWEADHRRLRMCVHQPKTLSAEGNGRIGEELALPTSNTGRHSPCQKILHFSPFEGKRTEGHLIGKAGNNAPVGLELIPIERVARLWRRLILINGNLIGRRHGTNYDRFCRTTSGRTRPL